MKFDPTPKEAEYIRQRFRTTPTYANLAKHFPNFDRLLDELPEIKRPPLHELKIMLCDALCEVRGLPHGSIEPIDELPDSVKQGGMRGGNYVRRNGDN